MNETPTTTRTTASSNGDAAPAAEGFYACEECGKELKGYTAKASGKTYTAADMAKFSIRDTGKVLCFDHKKEYAEAHR